MAAEPAVALRRRVIAACVEIMGCPAEHVERVVGPIEIVPQGWRIRSFYGDPTDNMIARQVADLMSRVWECAPEPAALAPDREDGRLFWSDGDAPQPVGKLPRKEESRS